MHEFQVDLSKEPAQRWNLKDYPWGAAAELLDLYEQDLGGSEQFSSLIEPYLAAYVPEPYRLELESVARHTGTSLARVASANLYYDAMKFLFGCTAFACEAPDGPFHARNLDWWTEQGMLGRHTQLVHFINAEAGDFTAVSWPGFIGVLSGVAAGRFSITLNAVLSSEPAEISQPITLFLRSVFEQATTYQEAVERLTSSAIASDCLLLVVGTQNNEMCVIERTPTRSVVRAPTEGAIVVANEYLALDGQALRTPSELLETSAGRFASASRLIRQMAPESVESCMSVLADPEVQMGITMQQMVFRPADGTRHIEIPSQLRR